MPVKLEIHDMKTKIIAILCFLTITTGCGAFANSGMKVTASGSEYSIEPVSAFVIPNSSGGHSIQITNYQVDMDKNYDYSKIKAVQEGNLRLDVTILKSQTANKQPIASGEYKKQDPKEKPKDKVVRATIYKYENGKENPTELDNKGLEGSVIITSVEGNFATGTIDLSDGKSAIRGSFRAKVLE